MVIIASSRLKRKKSCDDCMPEDDVQFESGDLEDLLGGEDSVSAEGNKIYFYSDIDRNSVLKFNKALCATTITLQKLALDLGSDNHLVPVSVYINSNGGTVTDGLLAAEYILKNKIPVNTIVDGSAASAATFMTIVGKRRMIRKSSVMLIHQLSGGMMGSYTAMGEELQNCETLMNIMRELYGKYTKIPTKVLNEILKRDLVMTSKECLKWGLVDEII